MQPKIKQTKQIKHVDPDKWAMFRHHAIDNGVNLTRMWEMYQEAYVQLKALQSLSPLVYASLHQGRGQLVHNRSYLQVIVLSHTQHIARSSTPSHR
jgi:hypothetical protein